MNGDAASRAARIECDGNGEPVAAARAPEYFVRPHQVWRARTLGILQRPSGRALLRWPLLPRRFAFARFVLIAALSILAIAHGVLRLDQ
jgi:hypothetical protein